MDALDTTKELLEKAQKIADGFTACQAPAEAATLEQLMAITRKAQTYFASQIEYEAQQALRHRVWIANATERWEERRKRKEQLAPLNERKHEARNWLRKMLCGWELKAPTKESK